MIKRKMKAFKKKTSLKINCLVFNVFAYSGNILLVAYTYDGDGTITPTLDRDLDLNQNLNINDHSYMNRLTDNQRQLINKVNSSDTILYELTEYVMDRNQEYSQILMQRDGAGNLSTLYTYGNQRINTESVNNLSCLYTYDGRGSVSSVIGAWGDYRATYWYDGLGNVKSQIHGFGAFGSGKRYFGYNAEQYNPVTGNQNLRNRQVNIRRQRFLSEDIFIGNSNSPISLNRYIYANENPLKFKDPTGFMSDVIMTKTSKTGSGIGVCGGGSESYTSTSIIYNSLTLLYGSGVNNDIQAIFKDSIIYGFTNTQSFNDEISSYVKYGFTSSESWTYWSSIANNAITAELISRGVQGRVSLETEAVVAGQLLNRILSKNNNMYNELGIGPTDEELKIAQAIHYTRNKYNNYNGGDFPSHIDINKIGNSTEEDIYTWNRNVPSSYHQDGRLDNGENIKLVDKSGRMEVIYNANGDIVYDPRDIGTYNFAPSDSKEIGLLAPIAHMGLDVVPWSDWGNSENDTTKPSDRKDALYYAYTFFTR